MQKIVVVLLLLLCNIYAHAQKDVTRFLGIPVDGSKTEMVRKLKAKGFTTNSYDNDILNGEFNGHDVNIHIATNGNKVWRIMVCDANPCDERSIQIRFNKLCDQFERNKKYGGLVDYRIPDDENISYEMTVHKKRYEAVYYQQPEILTDSVALQEYIQSVLLEKYTLEEIANATEETKDEISKMIIHSSLDLFSKKSVWFMISEIYGKYYISMFYDNEYNHADGEDL